MTSAAAKLPQNRGAESGASIAPGIASMIALSTISMTVIDAVSEASAMPTAALKTARVVAETRRKAWFSKFSGAGYLVIPLGDFIAVEALRCNNLGRRIPANVTCVSASVGVAAG